MHGVYEHFLIVAPEDVDTNGHVNNVEYVRWMQDAAVHHSESIGGTAATLAQGATWVVRAHRIEYLRPAFAGEGILVLTWVATLRRVRSLRRYLILRQQDREILAKGETDWVFVDRATGRPRSIPPKVAAHYVLVDEKDAPAAF